MEWETLKQAIVLLFSFDKRIYEIILLTILLTITSTGISLIIALPLGSVIGKNRFIGRSILIRIISTFMGFPPVLAGLIVYLLVSSKGTMGFLGILYTPYAMLLAQVIIIVPILSGLIIALVEQTSANVYETCQGLGLGRFKTYFLTVYEGRTELLAAVLTGYGRAISEVGAVMLVGGNIEGSTRVMTTAIVLETGKGNYELALALGIVLIIIAFIINSILRSLRSSNI